MTAIEACLVYFWCLVTLSAFNMPSAKLGMCCTGVGAEGRPFHVWISQPHAASIQLAANSRHGSDQTSMACVGHHCMLLAVVLANSRRFQPRL
jgi:hypothetical protein